MNIRLGIDPGLSGAVAALSEDDMRLISIMDMPTMSNGKRKQVNPYELNRMMPRPGEGLRITAYLEQVSSMPRQGVASMFSFGVSYGIIQGVLASLGIPVTLVTPVKWKRRAGLIGKDKELSRTLAQRLYPRAELGKKKDVGKAEAILIARFGG